MDEQPRFGPIKPAEPRRRRIAGPARRCVDRHCSRRGHRRPPWASRPRAPLAPFALLLVAASRSPETILGFSGVRGPVGRARIAPSGSGDAPRLSAKDEAAPFGQPRAPSPPAGATADALLGPRSVAVPMATRAVVGLALVIFLSVAVHPSAVARAYSGLLAEYPLLTKSLTSGTLCGASDVIAQLRDPRRRRFNYGRLMRFAGKGCVGGMIWSFWYDNLDRFFDMDSSFNIFALSGISGVALQWIRGHLAIVTTALSIVIEQFLWCPIVFGTFEIPVSTLLNGGALSTVPAEVDSKLNGLLISNAKVWTFANVIIYNAPVDWRPVVSNCVDLFWQSIVSDVAADCGKVADDFCEVVDDSGVRGEEVLRDYAFYAEKSRL